MSTKWTLKYGLAAVLVSIILIAVVLFANPLSLMPSQNSTTASYVVMLTDPPIAPAGTTVLDLTYNNITLHVVYTDGTSYWLPVDVSDTVDLFELENVSQTIASVTIPINATVDKIQFGIASVEAVINGTVYPVTALSSTLVISIESSQSNQMLSGALVDFNPTLVQIQATDANGNLVNYYVLVPSATAMVVTSLSRAQIKVGTIVKLGQNDREKLVRVVEEFSNNVTVSASLSVNNNVTSLSVTLTNEGDIAFRIFGLTLNGTLNATGTWETMDKEGQVFYERVHPGTIPFRVNDTSLIPFACNQDDCEGMQVSSLTLNPGQSVTLSFSGVIELQPKGIMTHTFVVTPIVGDTYTVRLMGEGFQASNVTASS
jgi:hypothetical protein